MIGLCFARTSRAIQQNPLVIGGSVQRCRVLSIIPSIITMPSTSRSILEQFRSSTTTITTTTGTTPFHENPVYFLSHLKAKGREQRRKENIERRRLQKDAERRQRRLFKNQWKQRQKDIRKNGQMRHNVFVEYIQNVREQKIEYVLSAEEERQRKRMGLPLNRNLSISPSFPQNPRSVHYQLQTKKNNSILESTAISCQVEEPADEESNEAGKMDPDLSQHAVQENECLK